MHMYVRKYIHYTTLHCITLHYTTLHCRTFRIGQASQAFQEEIAQWRQKHPGKKRPRHFLCHLRITGCLERGALKELPLVLLAPSSRPPTESLKDVQPARLFQRLVKSKKNVYMLMETRLGRAKP